MRIDAIITWILKGDRNIKVSVYVRIQMENWGIFFHSGEKWQNVFQEPVLAHISGLYKGNSKLIVAYQKAVAK